MTKNSNDNSMISRVFMTFVYPVTYPGRLGARYTGLGAQTLAPKKSFLTFYLKIFSCVSLFNLRNLENVLQRNLRTGTARECIFRASGGTRFKNFRHPWWRKEKGGTPRCNRSAQKNSGCVTGTCEFKRDFSLSQFQKHLYIFHFTTSIKVQSFFYIISLF